MIDRNTIERHRVETGERNSVRSSRDQRDTEGSAGHSQQSEPETARPPTRRAVTRRRRVLPHVLGVMHRVSDTWCLLIVVGAAWRGAMSPSSMAEETRVSSFAARSRRRACDSRACIALFDNERHRLCRVGRLISHWFSIIAQCLISQLKSHKYKFTVNCIYIYFF